MKVIIIGSLAKGVSAVHKIFAGSPSIEISIYEKNRFFTCSNFGLPYYITKSMETIKEAIYSKEKELETSGMDVYLEHEVIEINTTKKQITIRDLKNNHIFTDNYDKLVIATGSRNHIPNVPGVNKVGVQTLKSVEDLVFLKEYTKTPYVNDICILGVSYAGLEIAKSFIKLKRKVRMIEEENRLFSEFDTEVNNKILSELKDEGIEFSIGETVRRFHGRTFVDKIETTQNSYDCDLCIVATQAKANSEITEGTGIELDKNGSIVIDENLETNVKDIFAVGDCAISNKRIGRTFSFRAGDLEIARTGFTEEEAKRANILVKSTIASSNDQVGIFPHPNNVTIKLVYDSRTRKVLGAQGWGKKSVSARINAIAVSVYAGMTIEQLSEVSFDYSSENTIWDPVLVACNAVK